MSKPKPKTKPFEPVKKKLDCGTLELREYRPADAGALNKIFCDPVVNDGLLAEPCSLAESKRHYAEEGAAGKVRVVALLNGRVVGNISVRPCKGRSSHVTSFGIMFSPSVHGLGVASAALGAVFDYCRKAGFEIVRGDVFAANARARAFYKKMGFAEVGTVPGVAKYRDGRRDDEIVIVKKL